MHKKNILTALLLIWVFAVVAFFLHRQADISARISGDGPLALSADGQGGFYLATPHELLHFNAQEELVTRRSATALGLRELNDIHALADGRLWIYDSALRRPFICVLPAPCQAFGPTTLDLERNVSLSTGAQGQGLLLSDNTNHRLLQLSAEGLLLDDGHAQTRHFPNQISRQEQGWLLANTDRFEILAIAEQAGRLGPEQRRLKTEKRPYRFVQREQDWWVVESGISLNDGELRHYRENPNGQPSRHLIASEAQDPVAIADTGARLIMASRRDWRLLSLDPTTGQSRPVAAAALQAEFTQARLSQDQARHDSQRLPWLMAALLAPALLGGLVVQRMLPPAAPLSALETVRRPRAQPQPIVPAPAGHIRPDPENLASFLALQNRQLLKVAGLLLLLLLPMAVVLLLLPSMGGLPIGLMLALMFLLPALALYLGRQATRRHFQQELVCGPQKLVLKRQGKPVCAVPYTDVLLGGDTLLLGRRALPLYLKLPGQRVAIWPQFELQRELSARLPPEQMVHDDKQLLRALLRYRHPYALGLLLKFFGLPLLVIVILAAKLLKYDWLWQWFL